jgi:hypothetical protein
MPGVKRAILPLASSSKRRRVSRKSVKRRKVVVGRPKRKYARKTATIPARLARLERTTVRTIFERVQSLQSASYTSLAPVQMFPLTTPASMWAGRTFNGALDSIAEPQATVGRITMNVIARPSLDSGALLNNTPYNEPILMRMFLVTAKYAYRQTVSSTTTNLLDATQLVKGRHYDYAIVSGMPFVAPMMNREYFSVLGYKDYAYMPTVLAANTTTATVDPSFGMKKWSFSISPKSCFAFDRKCSFFRCTNRLQIRGCLSRF